MQWGDYQERLRATFQYWDDGDADGAWQALAAVESSMTAQGLSAAPAARVVLEGARARHHLRAEQVAAMRVSLNAADQAFAEHLEVPLAAVDGHHGLDAPPDHATIGWLDARVTRHSWPAPATSQVEAWKRATKVLARTADACLRWAADTGLDATLRAAATVLGQRANNNLASLESDSVHGWNGRGTPEDHVRLWLHIEEARNRASALGGYNSIDRVAADLAFHTGSWERAWTAIQRALAGNPSRSEGIALHAHAAELAWERGELAAARHHSRQAMTASHGIRLPWVRLYAFKAGVIGAAAGAGDVPTALRAYIRCTDRQGHSMRPGRVLGTALIALEAGAHVAVIRSFVSGCLGDEPAPGADFDEFDFQLAPLWEASAREAEGDPGFIAALSPPAGTDPHTSPTLLAAPQQARVHALRARARLHGQRRTAAELETIAGLELLQDWPGRTSAGLRDLAARLLDPPPCSRAQRRVLDLLVEGLDNQAIAGRLGCAIRTVAVHLQALLKMTGSASRTELAVREVSRRFRAMKLDRDAFSALPPG